MRGRDLIARDIFLLLVTGSNQRAIRPETEVESIVGIVCKSGVVGDDHDRLSFVVREVPQFFKELKRGHYVSRERALH